MPSIAARLCEEVPSDAVVSECAIAGSNAMHCGAVVRGSTERRSRLGMRNRGKQCRALRRGCARKYRATQSSRNAEPRKAMPSIAARLCEEVPSDAVVSECATAESNAKHCGAISAVYRAEAVRHLTRKERCRMPKCYVNASRVMYAGKAWEIRRLLRQQGMAKGGNAPLAEWLAGRVPAAPFKAASPAAPSRYPAPSAGRSRPWVRL